MFKVQGSRFKRPGTELVEVQCFSFKVQGRMWDVGCEKVGGAKLIVVLYMSEDAASLLPFQAGIGFLKLACVAGYFSFKLAVQQTHTTFRGKIVPLFLIHKILS